MISRLNQSVQTMLSVLAFTVVAVAWHHETWPELLASKDFSVYIVVVSFSGWIAVEFAGLHRMTREDSYADLFFRYLKVTALGTGLVFVAGHWMETPWLDTGLLLLFAAVNMVLLYLFKAGLYGTMRFLRRHGFNRRQVLLIADSSSYDFLDDLLHTPDWGYHIFGVVSNSSKLKQQFALDTHFFAPTTSVERLLSESVIDELFYAKSVLDYEEINRLMALCANHGVTFRLRPGFFEQHGLKPKFTFFNSNPTVVFRNVPTNYMALKVKRGMDLLGAMTGLLVFGLPMLVIAAAIKLADGGPVFFMQERVGLYGRRFRCFKFRTMVVNAEALKDSLMTQNEQSGPVFKMKFDPRITRVGRFLRKYSFDELPQFLNVLNGDMSLVGPRPPVPSEVYKYQTFQNRRLSMKPGITCIWQVSGRNNIDFDDWVKLDMRYIDNWSLWLDIAILLKTVKVMIKGDGM